MIFLSLTKTLLLLLLIPVTFSSPLVHATGLPQTNSGSSNVTLEVWSPDVHSSNITSLTLFPQGSQFRTRVNITNAGPISGFDVTINYNITAGPNILQAVKTGTELSGGLFDPDKPPPGCQILPARTEVDFPAGRIRFAAVIQGGCSVNGSGTLFSLTFQVTGTGASFIDIVQTSTLGKKVSTIIGASPTFPEIPFQPASAYFRNKPGTPPLPFFSLNPAYPLRGDLVQFDASQSYDPNNSTQPGRGIKKYLWNFGDGTSLLTGVTQSHVFVFPILVPAAGSFSVTLVVWDVDDDLPQRVTIVVNVALGITNVLSMNWSGYAIAGPPGSVTDVKGSWIVPAIVGSCTSVDQHSSFWVGIDGLNSPTVEQTGTESACINGVATYFAWYEFFPKAARLIHPMTIHPGDVMSAEVRFAKDKFNVTLTDVTTGDSVSKSRKVDSAQLSSAEWIAEAPSSKTGILPLADFGTVQFGQDYTGVPGTDYATVGGTSGSIGSFGSLVEAITMVGPIPLIKANPSSLSLDKTSFTVQWVSAGP